MTQIHPRDGSAIAQLRREAPTGGLIANSRQASGLPDLRLGMSTLSKLHVYIAYKERKLYITSADDAPP